MQIQDRAGIFITQPSGYKSFVPKDLPPVPPVIFDAEMISLLSKADSKLGRLDGVTQTLPNPKLFVAMYVRKEAVLSSQIEGTQASLSDLLVVNENPDKDKELTEIVNYVSAMDYGLNRLKEFPLSLRLLREIHARLLQKGRGSERNPGEFRKSQNWIGPQGCTLNTATFVPPTVPDMNEALDKLEKYFYSEDDLPPLIKIALIHAQFESIHPFLDGNGRMGRLLITFWLCHQQILSQPLLYLSYYFKKKRTEYYNLLMDVRKKGDWESWIKFFLQGIASVSDEATNSAKDILNLKKEYEETLSKYNNQNYFNLLELLFENSVITKQTVSQKLGISLPTANKAIDVFCNENILVDIDPGKQRYKRFAFSKYMSILNRGTEIEKE